ncbi:MAG: IS21 family transposase [Paludibacter sp.]
MSQIKQLLQLHKQGMKMNTIARTLGISRNTVKSYLQKLTLQKMDIDTLLGLDDPILEVRFHAGNPAYSDGRFEYFKSRLGYYESELKRKHVTRRILWQEYRREQEQGYGYTQFCYHLSQQLIARKPSMVLNHTPGEKLFVDFAGDKLSYIDPQTGEIIYCQVFVACLPYSDYSFAMAVRSQSIEDFLYALSCALAYFGGVPLVLVPDNLKAAIVKANRYDPEINRALEDFANHYNFTVIPARVRKPQDKALVENQVKLIYGRVYAKLRNQQFFDLASLNAAISQKNKEHTQTRMQQKPYSREEKFLAEEKMLLQPLPQTAFELKYYRELKVGKNNHVYLAQDKHYYSVPFAYTGMQAKLIFTRSMVRIYVQGELVASHARNYRQGAYSTVEDHLCSHHKHYLDRSPAFYAKQAAKSSPVFALLVELMFNQSGRHPEQLYRSCDGLLSLQRKTQPDTFEKACQLAIDNQNYSYRFINNILTNKMTEQPQPVCEKPLPVHSNIRGKAYFTHNQQSLNFK